MPAFSTVQAGSTVIGSASGDSLIVAPGDEGRFGIGADLIVWPAGLPLDPAVNYDTMTVVDKTDNNFTVLRNEDHALDTIAEGDQVGLTFPRVRTGPYQQTQVLTFGKDDGYGPAIDLGPDALGIIGLITATISDVGLDGGTGGFTLDVFLDSSFDGTNWALPNSSEINPSSGTYSPWSVSYATGPTGFSHKLMEFLSATDPTPLHAHAVSTRYVRFQHLWVEPTNLGVNATATITFELSYY